MALSAVAQRSSVARPATASRRSAVVVKASAESRRAVLGGFLAGAALTISSAAQAVTPVDLFDDRPVRQKGFDLIYEARDLDLPQNVRDGMTQARQNLEETKKRVKDSEARIDSALEPSIKKNYWTEAREELRRQVGTLRFDLNALAQTKTKEEKKAALAKKKDFIASVEALDLALRQKDEAAALSKLSATKTALDVVLASVL
mmetsp:Transcript_27008/g.59067  ORF Transcript_27008/g.59067 Transcript_27008/m.59067 type:complete len:203 (-) Transcript_27008:270-878(-)|eukprot:CAMPEP_0202890846 /NCGR_PEP_ID=MMETSP1392-20130828/1115_1 /ASSEMBLY_ACC=CAM_ASM_000868 /TAXON_ID=225041 /ORGANISM="Chlamydomonas chlamydogama, Strain SAG 11-48b" /LENGTH=202 /DNA_ID=CAMNT_0049574489 /DNA_START=83 /DNA_END=691 /DNA_ORIENTATION=+